MLRIAAVCTVFAVLVSLLSAQDPAAPEAADRRRTARALAKQGSTAIPQPAAMVTDPDPEVRIETVKALVEIGTQRSIDPLLLATRDNDPEVQIRAADGLVNFYVPGYAATGLSGTLRRAGNRITSRFTDTNDQVIDAFVEVRPDVGLALGRLARSGSAMESRANAARAAGVLRSKAAVPDLLETVRSKDTKVIYECLIALQKIGDQSAGPRVAFLLRDLDENVQVTAVETAGLLRNVEALTDLKGVLARTESRRVRRAALYSIAMLPDESSRALFTSYLGDRDAELRAAAAEGLGRLKTSSDLTLLERGFQNEDNNLARLSFAFAIVMNGNLELTEFSPLQYMVNSLNSAARTDAAQALLIEAARDPRVRQALVQPLRRGTRDETIGLLRVMASSGDRESEPLLEEFTRNPSVEVASQAVRSLRNLRTRLR
jgi:HEAT repeat protein